MQNLSQMRSITRDNIIVTFGFYDAGSGVYGLPNKDQCWVTVTPNWSNWMGSLAPFGSSQASRPFTTLALPTSHDVGMNSMQNADVILNNTQSNTILRILDLFGGLGAAILAALGPAVSLLGPNIVTALAITEKDPLSTILATGARYFEFRPAHMSSMLQGSPLQDKLYFQHLVIPGMGYDEFLSGIVTFLLANPTEIVVVQIRWDGVHDTCARPDDNELGSYLATALAAANGSIVAGSLADMSNGSTIDQLRAAKKRLIMLKEVSQDSSYGDANSTLTPGPIVQTFPSVASNEPGSDIAIFQCQATPTNITDVVVYSAAFANSSTSPLLCTKPICDQETLPWLQGNLPGNMSKTELMIIMNDFFDGATADVAITLSQKLLNS